MLEDLLSSSDIEVAMAALVTLGRLHGFVYLNDNHLSNCQKIVEIFGEYAWILGRCTVKHLHM